MIAADHEYPDVVAGCPGIGPVHEPMVRIVFRPRAAVRHAENVGGLDGSDAAASIGRWRTVRKQPGRNPDNEAHQADGRLLGEMGGQVDVVIAPAGHAVMRQCSVRGDDGNLDEVAPIRSGRHVAGSQPGVDVSASRRVLVLDPVIPQGSDIAARLPDAEDQAGAGIDDEIAAAAGETEVGETDVGNDRARGKYDGSRLHANLLRGSPDCSAAADIGVRENNRLRSRSNCLQATRGSR